LVNFPDAVNQIVLEITDVCSHTVDRRHAKTVEFPEFFPADVFEILENFFGTFCAENFAVVYENRK
jgi:hypothetical protein